MNLEFGLNKVIPDNARAAWGCRAIFNAREGDNDISMDRLFDRQSMCGDEAEKRSLAALLKQCRVLEIVDRAFRQKVEAGEIRRDDDTVVTLYDKLGLKVQGSCNASYGYFYMSAWLEPHPLPLESFNGTGEVGPETLTWRNAELPQVGDKIIVKMNGDMSAHVVGHYIERHPPSGNSKGANFLFLLVHPIDPPQWWVDQTTRNFEQGTHPLGFVAAIMGAEWTWLTAQEAQQIAALQG